MCRRMPFTEEVEWNALTMLIELVLNSNPSPAVTGRLTVNAWVKAADPARK